jgi:hypothetical protein
MALKTRVRLAVMETTVNIDKVEQDGPDGVLVTFSDGTITGYVVEELLRIRPAREHLRDYQRRAASPPPQAA